MYNKRRGDEQVSDGSFITKEKKEGDQSTINEKFSLKI